MEIGNKIVFGNSENEYQIVKIDDYEVTLARTGGIDIYLRIETIEKLLANNLARVIE